MKKKNYVQINRKLYSYSFFESKEDNMSKINSEFVRFTQFQVRYTNIDKLKLFKNIKKTTLRIIAKSLIINFREKKTNLSNKLPVLFASFCHVYRDN